MCVCVCARAWATWLLSGPAAAASAPEIDPNNPDHFDMELEACLDAVAAHPGAMSAALHQQNSIYYPCLCFCQAFGRRAGRRHDSSPRSCRGPCRRAVHSSICAPLNHSQLQMQMQQPSWWHTFSFQLSPCCRWCCQEGRWSRRRAFLSCNNGFLDPVFCIHFPPFPFRRPGKHAHACMRGSGAIFHDEPFMADAVQEHHHCAKRRRCRRKQEAGPLPHCSSRLLSKEV